MLKDVGVMASLVDLTMNPGAHRAWKPSACLQRVPGYADMGIMRRKEQVDQII